jgi:hypothetical protein
MGTRRVQHVASKNEARNLYKANYWSVHLNERDSHLKDLGTLRVVRKKNLVVRPAWPGTKNDCAVEGQQQLSGRYLLNKDMFEQMTQ